MCDASQSDGNGGYEPMNPFKNNRNAFYISKTKSIKMSNYNYKNVASHYDNLSQQHKWQAPELLYKYLSKYVRKETKLLDIGVGTGISSQRFHEKQVELYGLDNSSDMLAICEAKGIFKDLKPPFAPAWEESHI